MDSDLFWTMYWLAVGGMYYYSIKAIFFDNHD